MGSHGSACRSQPWAFKDLLGLRLLGKIAFHLYSLQPAEKKLTDQPEIRPAELRKVNAEYKEVSQERLLGSWFSRE